MKYLYFLIFVLSFNYIKCENWAILVAGSNNYWNYRHQSDICHAYQILHQNDFPDSNIITMMYDDIAFNPLNPYQGIILNNQTGSNVYESVPKDYVGDDVNPTNFLAVLQGNKTMATGKVLNSGPDDNIFIYFADHGGTGLIAFPNEYLYAHDLINTFKYMWQNNKYKYLVFYLEACESGSMFNNILPSNMNIFATTAATPFESSYACYFDKQVGAYLGDVYSVNFLQNSDSFQNIWDETLEDQFIINRNETMTSTVCQYGDLNMSSMNLSNFLLFKNLAINIHKKKLISMRKSSDQHLINSRDTYLYFLLQQLGKSNYNEGKILMEQLKLELFKREFYDRLFSSYYDSLSNYTKNVCHSNKKLDTYCLQNLIELFENQFGRFSEYGLKYIKVLAEFCTES